MNNVLREIYSIIFRSRKEQTDLHITSEQIEAFDPQEEYTVIHMVERTGYNFNQYTFRLAPNPNDNRATITSQTNPFT